MRQKIKHNIPFAIFILILFFYLISYIGEIYGFVFFPDEFGYWFYAAKAAGYDWSNIVSLGSYYSFGYSLILTPVFLMCSNAVTAYRTAVVINFILIGSAGYVLNLLMHKCSDDMNTQKNELYTILGILYVSILFYAKTTLTETLLMTGFILVSYILYGYMQNRKKVLLLLVALSAIYMYTIHMRSLAVIIALAVTILVQAIREHRRFRMVLTVITVSVVLLILAAYVRGILLQTEYAEADTILLDANGMKGQIPKLLSVFTGQGLIRLLQSLSGKLLYMGIATFGLAYWGIRECIVQLKGSHKYFYIFLILTMVVQLGITTIYNINPHRTDEVIYGRYHEYIFPIFMALGAYAIARTRRPWIFTISLCGVQAILTAVCIQSINNNQLNDYQGFFSLGMSYLYNPDNYTPQTFMWKMYGCGVILTLMFTYMIWSCGQMQMNRNALWMLIALEVIISVRLSTVYTDYYNQNAREDVVIANHVEQLQEQTDRRIVYVDSYSVPIIDSIQFQLRDVRIDVIDPKEQVTDYTDDELRETDLVLIAASDEFQEQLMKIYDQQITGGHFTLLYNER